MKAEYIRDDIEVSFPVPPGHEEQYEYREVLRNGEMVNVPFWKLGATIEHPQAYMLVHNGCAIPADEACRLRARMTPEAMAEAQKAHQRISLGIHPDDYELYEKGIIAGYEPDGSYKPGPNFHLLKEAEDDESDVEESEEQ